MNCLSSFVQCPFNIYIQILFLVPERNWSGIDTVRKVNVSQEAAHWMAALAMEQYGYYLADGTDVRLIHDLDTIGEGARILIPYTFLNFPN